MKYLWVLPCAGRNLPAGMTPSKGAHNTCRFERTGELPPRGGQHRCSSLPCSLWVVPYAGRNPPMLVGCALCRAEPSMTCVGRGPVAKPPLMGPAAGTWRGSQTALSEPPTGDVMNYLWVVPYAGRNPPAGMTPSKGAHNTCRFERTGELPPRGGQHRCSSLPCSLWVVPYAGRNPPMLVGRALCRAEPSMTCVGRGPVAKPPVMGPAAGTWRGSQVALSEPPTGGCHELLVGGALCRAEPSRRHDAQQRGPQHMPFREDRGAAPPRWTAQVFLPSLQLVGGALCRAEPSHACGSCPMPGGTLHDLCGARASGEATTDGSCSRHMARVTDSPERAPHRRCHELLVGGALCRVEPSRRHDAQQRGPQHMPFREDRGAAPPRWTAQVFLPSLQLVGGALCRAEPSHACGSCPMPGGTLHDLCGARASGEATTDGSCSRHMARVTDSPERAPHRRMS